MGHPRNYSERQVFRHKAKYGVLGVSVIVLLEAPPAASVAGPESFLEDLPDIPQAPEDLPDIPQAPEVLLDIPHDAILAVGAEYDDQVFAGSDPKGPGRPRNSFIVHDPARLELLLDMCTKHNLTCDGEISLSPLLDFCCSVFGLHSFLIFLTLRLSLGSLLLSLLIFPVGGHTRTSVYQSSCTEDISWSRLYLGTPEYEHAAACRMRVQGSLAHVAACHMCVRGSPVGVWVAELTI